MPELVMQSTCRNCGQHIYLMPVPKSKTGSYRWIVGNRPTSWKCGSDPAQPVQAHDPHLQVGGRLADSKETC